MHEYSTFSRSLKTEQFKNKIMLIYGLVEKN